MLISVSQFEWKSEYLEICFSDSMHSTWYGLHKFVLQSSTKLLDFVPHKCLTWLRSGVSEDSAWRVDVLTVWSRPDDAPSLPLPSWILTLSVYYQMCVTISLISIMDSSLPHSLRRSPLAFLCPATRGHQSQTFNPSLSLWLSAVSRLNLTLCCFQIGFKSSVR